jgi:DNA-binding SARP family transcriptional activator/tetratricopeptide (TPR) repeat protein
MLSGGDSGVRFRLLGPVEVEAFGRLFDLGGQRQARLLAALLCSNGLPVVRDRIVDLLWERPPRSARQQIYNTVTSLRGTLATIEDVRLQSVDVGYQISAPESSVDLGVFRAAVAKAEQLDAEDQPRMALDHLRTALELWRGPALAGLEANNPLIRSIAAQLDDERALAAERFLTIQLQVGDTPILGHLTELVAQHPHRESLRASLMLGLMHAGRQADALAVYEDCRRVLAEELGLDPGQHLQSLHQQVLRGELVVQTRGSSPPADERPAPNREPDHRVVNYLPRDTSEFTGRSREISELAAATSGAANTLVISAINGMGGVGKTALAVRVSHSLAKNYPDGQYFVDLHGFTVGTEPLTPDTALASLINQSGLEIELVPSRLEERSGLWRSLLSEKRALVVLDNAVDESQVRPLLPGSSGSLVLITSRRRLTALEGAVPLSLDAMDRAEAIDLFRVVAGPDRVAETLDGLAEVVELCGRLPLAIRIAAARFRDRSVWTIADLIYQLKTYRRRTRFLAVGDRSVVAVLGLSYKYLTDMQRRTFRLLSLHPGADFDAFAVAALTGITFDEAEECLAALLDYNLLIQLATDRFEFHDLLRDCANDLLDQTDSVDDRRLAVHRILDYYLYAVSSWRKPVVAGVFGFSNEVRYRPSDIPMPADEDDRAELFRRHQQCLNAACRFASEQGWNFHAWRIPCTMVPFLARQNYAGDSPSLFQGALAAATELDDPFGQMVSLAAAAYVARDRTYDAVEAQTLFGRAIEIAQREGLVSAHAALLADSGVAQLNDRRLADARETFSLGYKLAESLGNIALASAFATNLGVIAQEAGDYETALAQLELADTIGRESNSPGTNLIIELNIGYVWNLRGKPLKAYTILDEAVATAVRIGSRILEASALSARSMARRSLRDFAEATDDGRRALLLARELQQADIECQALNGLGEVFHSTGDLDRAAAVFKEASTAAEASSVWTELARAREGMAHVSLAKGDLDEARARWTEAITIYGTGFAGIRHAEDHLTEIHTGLATCPRCWMAGDAASSTAAVEATGE